MKKIRMARDGYILISIIFYIVGIVCMTIPSISPLVLCITGGIILVAYGIVKIIGYLSDDLYDLAFQFDLACGIFLIVLGVIVFGCNLRIRSYLSPGLGLLILLDAVLKVQTAKDGKEAVDIFEKSEVHYFDVILMDIMMPVMDGLTATKTIRSLERQEAKTIPIFAMTANAFLEDKKQSKEAGMNEHLSKPLDEKKLMNTIWKYTIGKNSNSKE